MSELGFSNIFSGATMMSLPREVLLEISKTLSLEERMTHLMHQSADIFMMSCMILVFGELFIQTLNLRFIRLIRYLDTIGIYGI